MTNNNKILEVKNLKKYFLSKKGLFLRVVDTVKAVDNISFFVKKGETLGLVGESGCGKTTAGKCICKLIEPTSGTIWFDGVNIKGLGKKELGLFRKKVQIIFQNPHSSLNPRMTVESIVGEPLQLHGLTDSDKKRKKIMELLSVVGLEPRHMKRYPHEFSGGQKQRIGIARALALNPKLIIADEPVSALDVSIQAQIINLLVQLQEVYKITYVFISHDLNIVRHVSDRMAVMRMGKIVELSSSENLCWNPKHPYTRLLLESIPVPDPTVERSKTSPKYEIILSKEPSTGCKFLGKCPIPKDVCSAIEPELRLVGDNHYVACHLD